MKRSNALTVSPGVSFTLSLAGALAFASFPAPAAAQPSAGVAASSRQASTSAEDDQVRVAQTHFQRGVQRYEDESYDAAFAEFSRAYESVPNYRVLYNLAQTQVERHDYVDALRLFNEYLSQGGSEVPAARRQATQRDCDELRESIATVRVNSNVTGGELWVDGRSRGSISSGDSISLNAGPAELRLQKPGYIAVTRQLTLVGGDSRVIDIELEPAREARTLAQAPRASEPPRVEAPSHTGLWVSLATTTLFAGATATFAVLTANENSTLDRELDQYQESSARLDQSRSHVRTYAALTDGFGVATAISAGSLLYFIIRGGGGNDEKPLAAAQNGVRVSIGASSIALRKDF